MYLLIIQYLFTIVLYYNSVIKCLIVKLIINNTYYIIIIFFFFSVMGGSGSRNQQTVNLLIAITKMLGNSGLIQIRNLQNPKHIIIFNNQKLLNDSPARRPIATQVLILAVSAN